MQKRSSVILQVLTHVVARRRYDTIFISNYAMINVIDELQRARPASATSPVRRRATTRCAIWLRPDKMAQLDLTPGDVAAAIREQNAQFAAGRIGQEPTAAPARPSPTR